MHLLVESSSFLRNRKYYEGTMIAHLSDRDMYDFELAQTYKKKLERLYLGKNLHLLQ
ncbi:Hypothetical protein FBFL15_0815 [Flavobacterium branchiophilum FL-15]|uniref:Uncharacterized protein n=1 Tax=Flavobacterium branchiophilum (strain FL-15) TaxID=1034807 RepID=G2Z6S7_FLABF|nr:Hypothetical protein FBFL15_0815 [Flavobacterium branchiophilum FL-15]